MTSDPAGHELVIDRFEGDYAVVEVDGGRTLDLPRWMLPRELKEGDVIRATLNARDDSCQVAFRVDPDETHQRRRAASQAVQRLRERDPGGDIEL